MLCRTNLTAAELADIERNLRQLAESRGGKSGLYLSGFQFIFVKLYVYLREGSGFFIGFWYFARFFFLKKKKVS